MKALFSAANEAAKSNSTSKTVFGLVFATVITGAAVAGLAQQTGQSPAHWSAGISKVAQPAATAVASAVKRQAPAVHVASTAGSDRTRVAAIQLSANFPAVR